jgi:cytochrome P450
MNNMFRSTADYDTVPNPYDVPIEQLDCSDFRLPNSGLQLEYYKRIREEDPVHYLQSSKFGPYWSITRYKDMQEVESKPDIFSSAWQNGGVLILDGMNLSFMSMDDPLHAEQRTTLAPMMTPSRLNEMSMSIRQRTVELLKTLPRGEAFDWVEKVSIELTTRLLAILLDFPFEDRHLLPYWTEWATNVDAGADPELSIKRQEILGDMSVRLRGMLDAKKKQPPAGDLLSVLAHSKNMSNLNDEDFMGLMVLLIVGGNDTTRNSMTALVQVMEHYPEEWEKVRQYRSLMPVAAQETIRWWSPVCHQRRNVTQDTVLAGKHLKKGDKVVLWFKSANRDETAFPQADTFDISRENGRRHMAFGFGIHRCFGARLGELQVAILAEEILNMGLKIKLEAPAVRTDTCMINGFEQQLVSIVP